MKGTARGSRSGRGRKCVMVGELLFTPNWQWAKRPKLGIGSLYDSLSPVASSLVLALRESPMVVLSVAREVRVGPLLQSPALRIGASTSIGNHALGFVPPLHGKGLSVHRRQI